MTQTTVSELLAKRRKLSELTRDLRFQILNLKKQMLNNNSVFVKQKSKLTTENNRLKKEINVLKGQLNSFMMDDFDFVTDPDNGIIDITQPTTPQKLKKRFVR